jgi:hypothetical protein
LQELFAQKGVSCVKVLSFFLEHDFIRRCFFTPETTVAENPKPKFFSFKKTQLTDLPVITEESLGNSKDEVNVASNSLADDLLTFQRKKAQVRRNQSSLVN